MACCAMQADRLAEGDGGGHAEATGRHPEAGRAAGAAAAAPSWPGHQPGRGAAEQQPAAACGFASRRA